MPASGRAPCAPLPVIAMSKNAPPAIIAPSRIWNLPTASPGRLCMPKIDVAREFVEQPVLDHRLGAAEPLLGRLEDEMHGAVEIAALRRDSAPRRAASSCARHGRRHASGRRASSGARNCWTPGSAGSRYRRAGRSCAASCRPAAVRPPRSCRCRDAPRSAELGELCRRRGRRCAAPRSRVRDARGCRAAMRSARRGTRRWLRKPASHPPRHRTAL